MRRFLRSNIQTNAIDFDYYRPYDFVQISITMNAFNESNGNTWDSNAIFKFAIQLLALGLLLVACFFIFEPFITPFLWGIILAIALAPLHAAVSKKMGGRQKLAAALITSTLLLLILVPSVWLLLASAGEIRELGETYRSGELHIPPPDAKVKEWPLIGPPLYASWLKATDDLSDLLQEHREQVRSVAISFMGMLANTAKGILMLGLASIAAGILLAYGKSAAKVAKVLFARLGNQHGSGMAETAKLTVRSVVKGILGVALIQSVFVGIGITLAGVPFAGIWTVLCLLLSIIQVGIIPVVIGIIIYIWSAGSTLTAVLLTIWLVVASVIDNILKPILLGKGAPVPMLVVFIGAIGGFIHSGMIGLFTGAVLLSFGYKLAEAWLREPSETGEAPNVESGVAGM